jgi:hypothetical protein
MKGKISAFICLGYGVMHATSKGSSYERLGAISSQGDAPSNNPYLVTRFTSLMMERVYLRSTTQDNHKGGPYQRLSTDAMIYFDQVHNVFLLKVINIKGKWRIEKRSISLTLSNVAILVLYDH